MWQRAELKQRCLYYKYRLDGKDCEVTIQQSIEANTEFQLYHIMGFRTATARYDEIFSAITHMNIIIYVPHPTTADIDWLTRHD